MKKMEFYIQHIHIYGNIEYNIDIYEYKDRWETRRKLGERASANDCTIEYGKGLKSVCLYLFVVVCMYVCMFVCARKNA